MRHLLCLLGSTGLATNVPADVGRISSLADDTLEGVPALASSRWGTLVGKLSIDASSKLVNGFLDEAALRNAGAEKDGVNRQQDPRTSLEKKRGTNNAEPESNFKHGNERHGAVIILLDKFADSLGSSRTLGPATSSGCGRRLEGGQQVRAHIGSNVEDRVHGKRQYGKWDLAREEPDKSHD